MKAKTSKAKKSGLKTTKLAAPVLAGAPVLYQRLGSQWYAFMEVAGEVYLGQVSNEQIARIKAREMAGKNIDGTESGAAITNTVPTIGARIEKAA